MAWLKTEQEDRLEEVYGQLSAAFTKLDNTKDPIKVQAILKEVTNQLKDAKTLVKEFEKEARADGMPAKELADRKRQLVTELNNFIGMKKQISDNQGNRDELLTGARVDEPDSNEGKSTVELMRQGRKEIDETGQTLNRTERILEDTKAIGGQVAATLNDQTEQMNKVVDHLNDIEFNMKKASKVIGDITRGLLTDRCIGFFLVLVVLGVVAIIVLKILKPNADKIEVPKPNVTLPNATEIGNSVTGAVGRKMLEVLRRVAQDGRLPS